MEPDHVKLPLWREDRLLVAVVVGTAILSSWVWWVPIRCVMDGPAFQWSNSVGRGSISGAGMQGDFLVLALLASLLVGIVYMGWRGAPAPFKALLALWWVVNFSSSAIRAMDNPAAYRFRGDTMGVDINLAWFMPVLTGGMLLLTLAWVARDLAAPRTRTAPQWNRRNTRFLIPVLIILPIQFIMLRFGPMHDVTDQIGWILTYSEWLLLNLAFMPWNPPPPEASRSPVLRSSPA